LGWNSIHVVFVSDMESVDIEYVEKGVIVEDRDR
jgi:hypothetical protein